VLEAMACGAPVITCRNSSIIEIAGDAAVFVGEDDPDGMAQAIEHLGDPAVREAVIARGAAQASKFSFAEMARQVAEALLVTHHRISRGELARPNGIWQDLREALQTSQSPRVVGLLLRQELRRQTLATLRKLGNDPSRSLLWAVARELQRDPARWMTIVGSFLQNGFERARGAPRQYRE
jgi:hypothetical protein